MDTGEPCYDPACSAGQAAVSRIWTFPPMFPTCLPHARHLPCSRMDRASSRACPRCHSIDRDSFGSLVRSSQRRPSRPELGHRRCEPQPPAFTSRPGSRDAAAMKRGNPSLAMRRAGHNRWLGCYLPTGERRGTDIGASTEVPSCLWRLHAPPGWCPGTWCLSDGQEPGRSGGRVSEPTTGWKPPRLRLGRRSDPALPDGGRVVNVCTAIATGVNADGQREILGVTSSWPRMVPPGPAS